MPGGSAVNLLGRLGGFWVSAAALAGLTFVTPLVGRAMGLFPSDFVAAWMLVGSVVLSATFVEWGRASWARKLLRERRGENPSSLSLMVRVNELDRWRSKTFVVELGSDRVHIRGRDTSMTIPAGAVTAVREANHGPLRADSVIVETSLFGPIELVPLREDGVLPTDRAANQLATSIAALQTHVRDGVIVGEASDN